MDSRDQVVNHILALEKHVFQFVRMGGLSYWKDLDLTMPQLKALILTTMDKPMRASQLAHSLNMTLSTATGVVDRLVSQGLVDRLEDPSDRRIVLLKATTSGRETVDSLLRSGRALLTEILERLSLEQLQVVANGLDLLHDAAVSVGAVPLEPEKAEPEKAEPQAPTPSSGDPVVPARS